MAFGVARDTDAEVVAVALADEAHEVDGVVEPRVSGFPLVTPLRGVAAKREDERKADRYAWFVVLALVLLAAEMLISERAARVEEA